MNCIELNERGKPSTVSDALIAVVAFLDASEQFMERNTKYVSDGRKMQEDLLKLSDLLRLHRPAIDEWLAKEAFTS